MSDVKVSGVFSFHYQVECERDGRIIWSDEFYNTTVNEGLDELLDRCFNSSGYTSADYVGLVDGTPTFNAGDTLASMTPTEVTAYSEGARQAYSPGAASSQSVTNSGSKASFSINGSATIGGAFICDASTGTSGTLIGGAAFSGGNRSVQSGDTVNVTVTCTMASA